ncbi:hypothetical protein LPJ81_005078 [Coemansia sp. IMI 209127]|nr:hypothetical protein LPJ81_005078 [Coemansia sp. IMI 209127]
MAEDDDELTDDDDDDDEDSSGNGYHRHASNGDGSRHDLGSLTPGRAGVPTADKPYACDQCELTFSRQHNLKSHALTHSTERPFSCNVCHTPFRRQHDLKRHMKLHTGEKPYKCTNCERSFARLDALNRHMRAENFHACNQAAKKARTSVMVLDRASRLKSGSSASASVAYLEQRRASTTTTAAHHQYPPPGSNPSVSGGGGLTSVAGAHAPSSWSHWTHRPSIAADEAMLRRMHERFGAPPSYAPVQPQKSPYYTQAAAAVHKHQPSSAAHAHHHTAASTPYGSSGDLRAYGPSQQPHSQHYASGIHQQQQQPPVSAPLMTSPGTSGGGGTFAAATSQQHQLQTGSRYRGEDSGNTAAHGGTAPLSAISYPVTKAVAHPPLLEEEGGKPSVAVNKSTIPQQYRQPSYQPLAAPHPQQQQQQPPPLSVHHQSHPPPHPAQMRLPPIELVAPRRHSLAVTSHLERYRARGGDGATPPQSSDAKSAGDSSKDGQQQQQQPREAAANASVSGGGDDSLQPPPYQQHVQKRMYAENESPFGRRGPTQKPPASFLNYTPSVSRQSVSGASLLSAPSNNGVAIGNSADVKSAVDGVPPSVHALPTSRQPGYYHPGQQQQQQHSAPLPAATNGTAPVGNSEAPANVMAGGGGSRRESSTYSPSVERIADTRRSSIIALTNPQSEDDLRTENADLKRRIDEMEAKYLKEVDRLNQVVHELEIEKSLLKTLLIEKGDEAVSPLKQQNKVAVVSSPLSSPKQQGGGSANTTTGYSRRGDSPAGIRRQLSLSEQPLVQSVGHAEEKGRGSSGSLK